MRAALLIVLSLSTLALAGPAVNKNNNNIQNGASSKNPQQYMTGDLKQTQATETLKQWCFSSHMSQTELTASFKKLVSVVKSSPEDQSTEAAVMSERICQTVTQKQTQSGETVEADAQAHGLIKDVYMDALLACESRQCMQQLIKIINSNQVDTVRASYYMTRIAVTEKDAIKDDTEVKQLAESFLNQQVQSGSEAVERQKLFATTALLGKSLESKTESQQQSSELKQVAEQVAKAIVERYIKPVSDQEVQQYQQQQPQQQSPQVAYKIAKRSAALKALANIPSSILKEIKSVESTLLEIAQCKQELNTARQSAIECLEQNDVVIKQLKQITFDQEEPTEVRIAAYRALMTSLFSNTEKDEQSKQQVATEIVDQVVKHCEQHQQQDDQFVLYVISHLDNLRTSQQPETQAIKEIISKNKQHYMQIQVLCKKFKQQLSDVRKSSRNYKLEQEFNQLESGLIFEGDIIYESKNKQHMQQQWNVLPKLIRVNVSMPVMGETVNVVEITVRQNQMDEELLSALKLVQNAKFNSESVSKVVDSFKTSVQQQHQKQQQTAEADLTIKVEGFNVIHMCADDFKSSTQTTHQRNARSVYSTFEDILEHLKRKPVAFNRGFNFNINERLAKVLDVDANMIAGLRFDSRAQGQSSSDFEIVTQIQPRFSFEAIVGPAKMSSKKLLQRVSTKTALGLRLRFKQDELVDVQIDLPMNTMELFTFETQMVEKSTSTPYSYTYLPESIYGQEDIYSVDEEFARYSKIAAQGNDVDTYPAGGIRMMKRSIFENSAKTGIWKSVQGKQGLFAHSVEVPEDVARATGLRGKLRVVASPQDLSFFVQAVAQKYEPTMRGYRVQVQTVQQRGADQEQYILALSTPGSRVERSMQIRVAKQSGVDRTVVKTEIIAPKMNVVAQYELIYDGRQYAVKSFVASTRANQQWRHTFECGVQRASQSQPGRIPATTYKPYLTLDSTFLKRPVQMQGVVNYQQSPKPVIKFEFKSLSNSADYVQGKIELEERSINKRASGNAFTYRRSMQSPIELLLNKNLIVSSDIVGQVYEQVVKVHNMIDWDADKWAVQGEFSVSHKNARKTTLENQILASFKVDQDQQMVSVQRKCPQEERKDFRLTVTSDCKTQGLHQFLAEYRFNGKRATSSLQSVVAYKHKIDYATEARLNKLQLGYTIELISSENQLNEKLSGHTLMSWQPKLATLQSEIQSRTKLAKLDAEFSSLKEHHVTVLLQGENNFSHRTSVSADKRQVSLISRTDKQGQMLAKIVLEHSKEQGNTQLVVEMPLENVHLVADLKPESGRLSTFALQSPRFTSNAEFSFESMKSRRANNKRTPISWWGQNNKFQLPIDSIRFKTDLRDVMNQEAYWIDSALFNDDRTKSYLHLDSPIYRADLEWNPLEQSSKFGTFVRGKRSVGTFNKIYSNDDSLITIPIDSKLNLGNKLWAARSYIVSPSTVNELKQQIRRAIFEYADRRQSHKHSLEWNPTEERVSFDLKRQPTVEFQDRFQPIHLNGDLSTGFFNTFSSQDLQQQLPIQRPSVLSMKSEWLDVDMDAMPYNGESCYAKLSASSRYPRSAFKKHESEISYSDKHGYKAMMKHQDAKNKHHSWELEADQNPKKWAKINFDSDKYGKVDYEHQWRKHMSKSQRNKQFPEGQDVYSNKVAFQRQPLNSDNDWTHSTQLLWEEPAQMSGRIRRDVFSGLSNKYTTLDYLKHINSARLESQTSRGQNELYNLDFDYLPESHARLNVVMPDNMLHTSAVEFEPTERTYKVQSKLYNRLTKEPSYDLQVSTKPYDSVWAKNHADSRMVLRNLLDQPLKLDYSDKYGRLARVDYDELPQSAKYGGLRLKRAALYFKDDLNDIEHQSSYNFSPESLFNLMPANKRVSGDFMMKTETKFGPVVLHVDSSVNGAEIKLESPVVNAKIVGEISPSKRGEQIIKITVDNKQKSVQLTKVVRKSPILSQWEIFELIASKLDQVRFEHQTEMLVNLLETIFKIKSQTYVDKRPVMLVDGEMNQQLNKAIVKLTGEQVYGQLQVDLMTKSATLVLQSNDKRGFQHQTRLVRINDKFFSLNSMSSYEQKPLFNLSGKISSMIFSEPQHLFSRRQFESSSEEHISTFDAIVYEPKRMQVSGQYDCLKKEARVIVKDNQTNKVQNISLQYDDKTENINIVAHTTTPRGTSFRVQKSLNVAPFITVY